MHPFYQEFLGYLEREDKQKCVEFVLAKLSGNIIDVLTLYREILAPSLNEMECKEPEEECIWREHVRSSIIRTVMECCYPYVVKARAAKHKGASRGKVLVLCPAEELHEIGARMVADAFTIEGYDVTFVGANTPRESFLAAVRRTQPKYVAVSVTSYYNLVAAKRVIADVRKEAAGTTVLVGGNAFRSHPEAYKDVGADRLVQTFEEIWRLGEGG